MQHCKINEYEKQINNYKNKIEFELKQEINN